MDIKDLILVSRNAQEMMVNALTEYVREHGDEMCNYYRDEFGMCEEDEEDVKIVKVLDVSYEGCYYSFQGRINDARLDNIDYDDENDVRNKLDSCFSHYAIWSLYIVREADGTEKLKYYMFVNNGVNYKDSSEPDHDYVNRLRISDLSNIYSAIIKFHKKEG